MAKFTKQTRGGNADERALALARALGNGVKNVKVAATRKLPAQPRTQADTPATSAY